MPLRAHRVFDYRFSTVRVRRSRQPKLQWNMAAGIREKMRALCVCVAQVGTKLYVAA